MACPAFVVTPFRALFSLYKALPVGQVFFEYVIKVNDVNLSIGTSYLDGRGLSVYVSFKNDVDQHVYYKFTIASERDLLTVLCKFIDNDDVLNVYIDQFSFFIEGHGHLVHVSNPADFQRLQEKKRDMSPLYRKIIRSFEQLRAFKV